MRPTLFTPLLLVLATKSLGLALTKTATVRTTLLTTVEETDSTFGTSPTATYTVTKNGKAAANYDATSTIWNTKTVYVNSCADDDGSAFASSTVAASSTSQTNNAATTFAKTSTTSAAVTSSSSAAITTATTATGTTSSYVDTYVYSSVDTDASDYQSFTTSFAAGSASTVPGNVSPATDVIHTGKATFYGPGQGNCGWQSSSDSYIVAISKDIYDSDIINPELQSGYCGKMITASYGGKSVEVRVVDSCGECDHGHLDLSQVAFAELADISVGILTPIEWHWSS